MNTLKYYFVIVGFSQLIILTKIQAQSPCFTINRSLGCYPANISIMDCSNFNTPNIVYRYRLTNSQWIEIDDIKNLVIEKPGVYDFQQIIEGQTFPFTRSSILELREPLKPKIIVSTCSNNELYIQIIDDYYDSYTISIESNNSMVSYQPRSDVKPYDTIIYNDLERGNYTVKAKGFFPESITGCGESIEDIEIHDLSSTSSIDTLFALDNMDITINYSLSDHGISFLQERVTNGEFYTIDTLIRYSNLIRFQRNLLSNTYCYRILTIDPCSNEEYTTDIICTNQLNIVDYEEDGIKLNWNEDLSESFSRYILIKDEDIEIEFHAKNITMWDDTIPLSCGQESCYQLVAINRSGGISMTSVQCLRGITSVEDTIRYLTTIIQEEEINIQWASDSNSKVRVYKSVNNEEFQYLDTFYSKSYRL